MHMKAMCAIYFATVYTLVHVYALVLYTVNVVLCTTIGANKNLDPTFDYFPHVH